jgi:hypothetical protein
VLTGTCHCGAVQIVVPSKPRRLTSCNCSICQRYGTLWAYYDWRRVKISARKTAIDVYSWGSKNILFGRCATCGCVTHWEPVDRARRHRMGINFRNFDLSVVESIRVRRLDGAMTWKFLD